MEDKKPGVEPKSIEQVLREKFKTGYDPVTLSVRARAINEESLDVSIEGHKFVVRGNNVSFISKGECGIQIPQAKTEEAAAVDEGKMAIAAAKAVEASIPGVSPTGTLPEEGNTNSPQSEPAAVCNNGTSGTEAVSVAGTNPEAVVLDEVKGECLATDTAPTEVEPA